MRERMTQEFERYEERIGRLEFTNLESEKDKKKYINISIILFILFIIILVLFCGSCYYVYITQNMNIDLLKESVGIEMKKILFNENLDRVINFFRFT
jgi:hypothetical protein